MCLKLIKDYSYCKPSIENCVEITFATKTTYPCTFHSAKNGKVFIQSYLQIWTDCVIYVTDLVNSAYHEKFHI